MYPLAFCCLRFQLLRIAFSAFCVAGLSCSHRRQHVPVCRFFLRFLSTSLLQSRTTEILEWQLRKRYTYGCLVLHTAAYCCVFRRCHCAAKFLRIRVFAATSAADICSYCISHRSVAFHDTGESLLFSFSALSLPFTCGG